MSALTFTVFGAAQTKGSTRAFIPRGWKRPIITNTNRNAKSWEGLIAEAAGRALDGRGHLLLGPIKLTVTFYLPRPKALPRTRTTPHCKAPDLDKLLRCCDAMTGVLWRDDSQIVETHATKQYAGLGDSPRAIVTIEPLDAAEALFFESERTVAV